uniref:Uncharacterized protein n=1 Tax=Aegilops tauschii subsp. strangulata TaxID=200361 RepID=A0A453ST15_AEGTS
MGPALSIKFSTLLSSVLEDPDRPSSHASLRDLVLSANKHPVCTWSHSCPATHSHGPPQRTPALAPSSPHSPLPRRRSSEQILR